MVQAEHLEEVLLGLGRQELGLEQDLRDLQKACREASSLGNEEKVETLMGLYDETQTILFALRKTIYDVENRLYSLRRNRK